MCNSRGETPQPSYLSATDTFSFHAVNVDGKKTFRCVKLNRPGNKIF